MATTWTFGALNEVFESIPSTKHAETHTQRKRDTNKDRKRVLQKQRDQW